MTEQTIDIVFRTIGCQMCTCILAAVICRVGLMTHTVHKMSWFSMLAGMGAFAAGSVAYILDGQPINIVLGSTFLAGWIGVAMYMLISMDNWRKGPPAKSEKKTP